MAYRVEMRLLTAKQAAAYLGVSLYTLKKMEYRGYLKPYRTPGGHRRYSQQMLDGYLDKSTEFSYSGANRKESRADSEPRFPEGGQYGTD